MMRVTELSFRIVVVVVNMVTFEKHLKTGLIASGANHVIRGLELKPYPQSLGKGEEPIG